MFPIIFLLVSLVLGLFFQHIAWFPKQIYKQLNQVVLSVCLPALVFFYIPKIQWNSSMFYLLGVSWLCLALSFVLFSLLSVYFKWSKKLTACLILTAGFGNTSFLGFPIISAMYGEKALEYAIIVDQPGTFVLLSTFGIFIASFFSSNTASFGSIAKKVVLFPPFIAFVVASGIGFLSYDFIIPVQKNLKIIGGFITPIALFSIGLQLRFESKSKHWKFLFLGLLYKLFLLPAILFVLYILCFKQKSLMIDVAIMEAAMAPMITSSIIAASNGFKPRLCSMMVGFGIPISLVSIWFWYWLLKVYTL